MGTTITVRDIDPGDKAWLQAEAKRLGLSMEAYVRKLIGDQRAVSETKEKPSEVFRRYFGPENGVELPPRGQYGYRPIEFGDDDT